MTIKRILVPISGTDSDRPTLRTALALARRFAGHVEALYRPFRYDRDDNLRRLAPAHYQAFVR